ncbi:MAG TPA: metalloregulator ArsR/SmtB family transcription factor [Mycoplana sp.]|jgi:ArsR family transcriptional regulator, virulence genes transcriptional regulator|nr:metalloregulator ArsR/SmtB family transcription factor [Mycoplana sp.]
MDAFSNDEQAQAEIATNLLSAMANPKRLLILKVLVRGEIAVGALALKVGLSQSALSQHLSKLRAQNLVSTRRDAQTIYYSSKSNAVLTILDALDGIYGEPKAAAEPRQLRYA